MAEEQQPERLSVKERRRRGIKQAPKRRVPPEKIERKVVERYDGAMLKQALAYVKADGDFPLHAWVRAGGNARTFSRYSFYARLGKEPYVGFMEQFERATAEHCAYWVKVTKALIAKKSDAGTAAKLLQARHKEWSARTEVVLLGDPHAALLLQILTEKTNDAELAESIFREYERRVASGEGTPRALGSGEGG